jgi:hypothetical protein
MRTAWGVIKKLDPLNLFVWADKKHEALGAVMAWLLLPFLVLRFVAMAVPIVAALVLFWTVPCVVWLTTFRGVGFFDAARYALLVASGRPEYDGPFGMNTDPATLGFGVMTIAGWVVLLAPLAVIWFSVLAVLELRTNRRTAGLDEL